MDFRNIHFAAPAVPVEEPPAPTAETVAQALPEKMRLRKVSVSPAEEYAARPGQVAPISDALAAMILSLNGRIEVTAKGAKIDRKELGGVRYYHHPDSIICNDLSRRERKWFYVVNRLAADRCHILDETGRYIETLPEKFEPGVLNQHEQATELARQKRQIARVASHLQRLHGKETQQAIEDARHNADTMTRYVQTLPPPDTMPAGDVEPAPAVMAGQIQRANRRFDEAKSRRASAVEIGRHLSSSRSADTTPTASDAEAEDWSDLPPNTLRQTTPIQIEKW